MLLQIIPCILAVALTATEPKQLVPVVRYGGNRPRYVAPPPPSRVYQRWDKPPKARLTEAARREMMEMIEHRPEPVDWDDYTTVSDCPYCPNRHAGGDCVPPRNRTDRNRGR
jgi:hypothetical protein